MSCTPADIKAGLYRAISDYLRENSSFKPFE
jgi:hypothetical protein